MFYFTCDRSFIGCYTKRRLLSLERAHALPAHLPWSVTDRGKQLWGSIHTNTSTTSTSTNFCVRVVDS